MKKKKNNNRGTILNSTHFNQHITVIDNDTHLTLCLVCKESITDDKPNNVSAHVLSSNHNENLKIMFKMCIPDDLCDKNNNNCMKIISNCVFDISILLKNETRYVHRYENHIVCLICQDIICEVKNCNDAVKNDICSHLSSEQHMNNIKQNVCWVYQLETASGFLMFHKTLLFCSVCNQTIQTQENDTVQSAVIHLLIEHPKELNVDETVADNDIDDLKQTEQEVFGNNTHCYLSDESCEEGSSTVDVGNTKLKTDVRNSSLEELNFKNLTKSPNECILSKLKENVESKYENKTQLSTKMEIAQRNNAHPFIITVQCSKTFTFCVVCKDIADDISGSHIYTGISGHLWSPRHKESIEPIIYQCIPDPFCDKSTEKYNELASVLNSETGCVLQCKNYVMCLICKNPITNITQSFETIRYDLVYHFGSKQHLNIMRENVWWFYYLQFSEDFIAFDNHISHCTKCATNLESIPYRVVQCVKEHLQVEDLILLDGKESELNLHENTRDCNELMCCECKEAVEIYNNDPEFSVNLHREKHRDLSEINNCFDKEVRNDAEYACPVCLEKIPIFNKDIELSVSLHGCSTIEIAPNQSNNAIGYEISRIFNNLPVNFKVHSDFIMLDGDDFYCTLCNCTFPVPNCIQDACEKVRSHITELYHKEQYNACVMITTQPVRKTDKKIDPWDKFNDDNDPNSLSLMNSVIDENKQYIGKCECYYYCKICKCCFLPFGNEQEILKIFASHFTCKNHKKKFGRYVNSECSADLVMVADENTYDESNESSSLHPLTAEKNGSKAIFKKIKCLPGYQLNSQYLVVQENTVYCKLCKISIPGDKINKVRKDCYSESHSMILIENAAAYITTHENKQLVNAADPCNEKFVNVLKKLAESNYRINNPTITPNLLYIANNGNSFFCIICNINIKFSVDGSTLVRHFMSPVHKNRTYSLNCNDPSSSVEEISKRNQLQSPLSAGGNKSVTCYDKGSPIRQRVFENISINISYFFEKFPKEYSMYRDFISMDGKNVTCLLCSFTLLSKKNFEADCKILQEHMSSRFHKEQYLLYKSNGTSNGSGEIMSKDPWEKFEDKSNFETRLEVQQLNEKNKEYFEKGKVYFMCCLCDAYFLYFNEGDMKNTFAAHCSTTDHVRNLKRISQKINRGTNLRADKNDKCLTMKLDAQSISRHSDGCNLKNEVDSVLKKPRSCFVVGLNQHYLRVKENQLFCVVCQEFIKISENESHLRRHCYSQAHNIILTKYSISFVEGLDENNTYHKTNKFRFGFENVLKKMAKTSYVQRNNTVLANLFFISYNKREFVCRLCDRNIRFTENGGSVMSHIISRLHAMNILKLNCIYRSHNQNENAPVEKLKDIVTDNNSELNISIGDSMPQIIDNQSTLGNVEMNPGELSVTSETLRHSHEIGDKLYKIPVRLIKSSEETVSRSPLKFSTYSSLDKETEFSSQSKRNEVLELSSNDASLRKTKIECDDEALEESSNESSSGKTRMPCDDEALEEGSNYSSLECDDEALEESSNDTSSHKTRIQCEDEALEESSNDSSSYKTRIDCDDSGNNIEMSCGKPLNLEIKSARLTWDLVDIYVSSVGFDNNVDFLCPVCNEVVTVIDEDVKVSFELHYKTSHSSIEELLSVHKEVSLNNKFIRELFDCLPDTHQNYMENITMHTNTLFCSLCKSFIETDRRDVFESAVQLYFHVLSKFHVGQETLQSAQEDLIQLRSKFQPEVHIFAKNNAPEDVKLIVSDSKTLPFEMHNVTKESLDKLEKHEETTFDHTKVLTYEGSSANEVNKLEVDFGCEAQFSRETHNSKNFTRSSLSEKDHKLSISDHGGDPPEEKSSVKVSYVISDLLKNLNDNLMVHQEFFTLNGNRVTCKLCSVTLNTVDVKSHLTDLPHKHGFLAELKRRIETCVKSEVKRLMFINNQLYCGCCQCYITPWSDFDSICRGVSSHLKLPIHRTSDSSSNHTPDTGNQESADLSKGAE